MTLFRCLFFSALTLSLVACVDSNSGPAAEDAEVSPRDDGGSDAGDAGTGMTDGGEADAAVERDAGENDAGQMDASVSVDMAIGPMDVTSCEEACTRYGTCGRLGDVFDDEASCLTRCQRIAHNGSTDRWFDCLGLEQCNLLHLCPVPTPEPLACDEVCALATECGAALPFADCPERCADIGDEFQACGEALFGEACGVDAFRECIVDIVYPQCAATCAKGIECNLVRPNECVDDCIGGLESEDGLEALLARQLHECVGRSGNDCVRLDACFNPAAEVVIQPDRAELCRLWSQCNLDEQFPCQEFSREMPDQFVSCFIGQLRQGCPGELFELFETCDGNMPDPNAPICAQLCAARHACGLIDDAALRECGNNCRNGGQGEPMNDDRERALALNECAFAGSCPDLLMCLETTGPAAECQSHCGRLEACGVVVEECQAECDRTWPRDRQAAYRTCVAEAGDDCDAVSACRVQPAPPCDLACNRIENECNNLNGQAGDCLAECDDRSFAQPEVILNNIACILAADVCEPDFNNPERFEDISVLGCLEGQQAPPRAVQCLAFCEATTRCVGDADGFDACLVGCIDGLQGDDAIRFAAARDCLSAAEANGCEALTACVPENAVADCDAVCGRTAECNLEIPNCLENCGNDPLGRVFSIGIEACIENAADCAAVQTCITGEEEPEEQINVAQVCLAWDACPQLIAEVGPCQEIAGFLGNDPAQLACVLGVAERCVVNPFEELDRCFGGGGENPVVENCDALCDAQQLCAADAFDRGACVEACRVRSNVNSQDDLVRAQPYFDCVSSRSCAELETCLESSSPLSICEVQCARELECGGAGQLADCVERCDTDFAREREQARRECLASAADCDAVRACEPPRPLPCDEACRIQGMCFGAPPGGPDGCVGQCEDSGFLAPVRTARQIICLERAGENCDAVFQCQEEPEPQQDACLAYCQATSEACQEDPIHDLGECIGACLNGFRDANGLDFAAAQACLGALPVDADCAALTACLPEDAPQVDCATFCEAVDGCRAGGDDCAARCAANPDRGQAGCVAEVRRTGGGCAETAACVGFDAPVADDTARALCRRLNECDPEVDPFICRLDTTPTPPAAAYQLECLNISACNAVDACLALEAMPADGCAELCADAVACAQFPDEASCLAACTGRNASPTTNDDFIPEGAQCFADARGEAMCDAAAAGLCLNVASCEQPNPLSFIGPEGGRINFDIRNAPDNYQGGCGADNAPEAVVALTLDAPARVTVSVTEADYDPLMYVRSACDDPRAELGCNDDFNELLPRVDIDAQAGTYYIFIEGFGGGTGRGVLQVNVNPR